MAQAEDLEAAAVRQDHAFPAHEAMQAAEAGDALGARPQAEMVGIGEDKRRTGRAKLVGRQRLDRGLRADRHVHGRGHVAVRRVQHTGARAGARISLQ